MDSINKKISILIPVYNAGKVIRNSLESVINQNYKDFEIILVNDCSVDDTLEVIDKIIRDNDKKIKDKNISIKVIKNKNNMGAGLTRNEGFKYITNEYFITMDSDDFMHENLLSELNKEDADLVIYGFNEQHNKDGKIIYEKKFLYDCDHKIDFNEFKKYLPKMIQDRTYGFPWNKLYKTEIVKKYNILFPVDKLFEDLYFNIDYARHIETVSFINKDLYIYNNKVHKMMTKKSNFMSITKNYYENYFDMCLKKIRICIDFFKERDMYNDLSKDSLNLIFDISAKSFIERKIENHFSIREMSRDIDNMKEQAKELDISCDFIHRSKAYIFSYCYIVYLIRRYNFVFFLKHIKK